MLTTVNVPVPETAAARAAIAQFFLFFTEPLYAALRRAFLESLRSLAGGGRLAVTFPFLSFVQVQGQWRRTTPCLCQCVPCRMPHGTQCCWCVHPRPSCVLGCACCAHHHQSTTHQPHHNNPERPPGGRRTPWSASWRR